eukprot:1514330-Rhodomonas_salina.3
MVGGVLVCCGMLVCCGSRLRPFGWWCSGLLVPAGASVELARRSAEVGGRDARRRQRNSARAMAN